MSRTWLLGVALLLLVAALPLVSLGMRDGGDALWTTGLVLLGAGGGLALLTRYAGRREEDGHS